VGTSASALAQTLRRATATPPRAATATDVFRNAVVSTSSAAHACLAANASEPGTGKVGLLVNFTEYGGFFCKMTENIGRLGTASDVARSGAWAWLRIRVILNIYRNSKELGPNAVACSGTGAPARRAPTFFSAATRSPPRRGVHHGLNCCCMLASCCVRSHSAQSWCSRCMASHIDLLSNQLLFVYCFLLVFASKQLILLNFLAESSSAYKP